MSGTTTTTKTAGTTGKSADGSQTHRIPLTPQLLGNAFQVSKRIPLEPTAATTTSLSFDHKGETMVTCSDDDTIRIYNTAKGQLTKTVFSKKYGCGVGRVSHKSSCLVYTSTKEDDTIRYLSLHDNSYLRYFKGHKGRVLDIAFSPSDDRFLSASIDKTVRLWDLRSNLCQGVLNIPSSSSSSNRPVVAWDPSGNVFAIAIHARSCILLYDAANFERDPFVTFHIDDSAELSKISFPPRMPAWTHLSFSNDGKYILLGTAGDIHYIIDSFQGVTLDKPLRRLVGSGGLESLNEDDANEELTRACRISGQEICWTPDGQFVIAGGDSGKIVIWNVAPLPIGPGPLPQPGTQPTLLPMAIHDAHRGPVSCIGFNPRYCQLATFCRQELALWLDRPEDE